MGKINFSKKELIDIMKIMQINTDNAVRLNRLNMQLENDLFHEKWKFRYVAKTLKHVAKEIGQPDLAVTEEELDAQIRRKEN
jgi:hypothetical protein|tara:strand:- start:78 stop:323 length:246 start_codon:yes stop_codon:yes gene_type:complete